MITVTEAASAKLMELIAAKEDGEYAVWVAIASRGTAGFQYDLRIIEETAKEDGDILVEAGKLHVYVDGDSADSLKDSSIDFIPQAGGFKIENPNPVVSWSDPVAQQVQDVIVNQINPGVAQHGGFVTLLDVKDNVVYIELGGGCVGCGLVDVTLKQGIEVMIKEALPQIEQVVDRTDHASGTNPYYESGKGGDGGYYQQGKGG
jgi:Fe/S biogenesis protein NfuA